MGSLTTQDLPWAATPPPPETFGVSQPDTVKIMQEKMTPMPLATHSEPFIFETNTLAAIERHYMYCSDFPVFHETAVVASSEGWKVGRFQN
ncbi:hypothetical protein JYT97_01845 [Haliea sp. AH-315-K21]|uniref:Uncharacterized protein n=1 Tax=SAR86 cluster bacterium TaxID=2030880 RepID=A0A2A5CBR0_9GAMM|nr:hypothetical protein [Haliea sp. AH-315-K21]PCJ41223.1 MAG: hypothetical protein COA71_09300 [SAR86 cluster bacterium]